jgi:hypothetical protein
MTGMTNTERAIRRGQRRRMDYYRAFALQRGLTPLEAARVAAEAERWFLQGVHMSAARLAVECELVAREAA